jgi:hypothetical protein
MRYPHYLLLAFLGLGNILAACDNDKCEGVNCAPCTTDVDDVQVVFDLDSAGTGFRAAELRGAYVVRYKRPGFGAARDTVRRLATPGNGFGRYYLALFQLRWPRAVAGSYVVDTLQAHNYRVVLPAANRQYNLADLELRSQISTEGCCACPRNVRRRLLLNGLPIVADGAGDAGVVVMRR